MGVEIPKAQRIKVQDLTGRGLYQKVVGQARELHGVKETVNQTGKTKGVNRRDQASLA